jgi:hypothetical protein
MTLNAVPYDRQFALAPLDEKADHVRGSPAGRLIIEYGDYECPYSRQAFHAIEQVERQLGRKVRFAFRHFPLTRIHPHTRPPCWPRWPNEPPLPITVSSCHLILVICVVA